MESAVVGCGRFASVISEDLTSPESVRAVPSWGPGWDISPQDRGPELMSRAPEPSGIATGVVYISCPTIRCPRRQ